jgi:hypothetical protein
MDTSSITPLSSSIYTSSLLTFNNDFTPSTPYIHKFRTEMCKNWELYGKCKYGDEVSIFLFLVNYIRYTFIHPRSNFIFKNIMQSSYYSLIFFHSIIIFYINNN